MRNQGKQGNRELNVGIWKQNFGPKSYILLPKLEKSNGGFSEGGFSNNRFVLKPDVAIASEVSILSKNSLAITDFHAKKTQRVQLFENPLPGTSPFAIPKSVQKSEGHTGQESVYGEGGARSSLGGGAAKNSRQVID